MVIRELSAADLVPDSFRPVYIFLIKAVRARNKEAQS